MAEFEYQIVHVSGMLNAIGDYLLRCVDESDMELHQKHIEDFLASGAEEDMRVQNGVHEAEPGVVVTPLREL